MNNMQVILKNIQDLKEHQNKYNLQKWQDEFIASLNIFSENFPQDLKIYYVMPVIALIDEIASKMEWDDQKSWAKQSLQWMLLNHQLAGEITFEYLQLLLAKNKTPIDLLQVYYLCLQLGLEGVCVGVPQDLIRWKTLLQEKIEANITFSLHEMIAQEGFNDLSDNKFYFLAKVVFLFSLPLIFLMFYVFAINA